MQCLCDWVKKWLNKCVLYLHFTFKLYLQFADICVVTGVSVSEYMSMETVHEVQKSVLKSLPDIEISIK